VSGRSLREDYPCSTRFGGTAGLILANNLHGVDIDPRCAQIAQLACGCGHSARSGSLAVHRRIAR